MLRSPVTRLIRSPVSRFFARSMFTAGRFDHPGPNWLNVSLAFGTSVALWGLLIKQHSEDVAEYKKRNGLE